MDILIQKRAKKSPGRKDSAQKIPNDKNGNNERILANVAERLNSARYLFVFDLTGIRAHIFISKWFHFQTTSISFESNEKWQ